MADSTGFLKYERELPPRRPVDLRLLDWKDVYLSRENGEDEVFPVAALRQQAARCMDCGIPFCHHGCPLGNLIPEWNDLVRRDDWREASERLHATNNFPEFTGKLCPAPCEGSCVLNLEESPVTIKQIEWEISEQAWIQGILEPVPAQERTGKSVAVVGSGPAGLAAAQQLTRAGHDVTVFERDDRIGGLLRYGIPEFKMEKKVIDRRLDQMRAEGTRFVTSTNVGVDVTVEQLRGQYDAVVLAGGATLGRDLPVPGRELAGIHLAMEYLPLGNRQALGELDDPPINARGKRVVIIGGGDTGADCLGTAHRQGALSVTQLEIMPTPPSRRAEDNPWPTYPLIMRVSSAHEEGGERLYSMNTERFLGHEEGPARGRVRALLLHEVERVDGRFAKVEGTDQELPADLVLLAMGFTGAQREGLIDGLGVEVDGRGNVSRDKEFMTTVPGVFVAGDMGRGQSLIVWAIAEGRAAAAAADVWLEGNSLLPKPIAPTTVALR